MGLEPSKSSKLVIFYYKFSPKVIYPLKLILQNLAWGSVSQVRTLTPNFTILAL